jgi:hypothetical protein
MDTEIARLQNNREKIYELLKSRTIDRTVTSNDQLTDFMVVHFSDFSRKAGQEYKELEAQVKKNKGNLVLVAEGTFKENGYPLSADERLGAISGPLVIDVLAGNMAIPTPGVAYKSGRRGEWMAVKGDNIDLTHEQLGLLGAKEGTRRIAVYFGDDVADYYRRQEHQTLSFAIALEMIGHPVPEDFAKVKAAFDLRRTREDIFRDIQEMMPRYRSNVTSEELRGQAVVLFKQAENLGMLGAEKIVLSDYDGGGRQTTDVSHYLRTFGREMGIPLPERKPEDAPAAESDMQLE